MKVILTIAMALLVGCSSPVSEYVTSKRDVPRHDYDYQSCIYIHIGDIAVPACSTKTRTMERTCYLEIKEANKLAEHNVSCESYDATKINQFVTLK